MNSPLVAEKPTDSTEISIKVKVSDKTLLSVLGSIAALAVVLIL